MLTSICILRDNEKEEGGEDTSLPLLLRMSLKDLSFIHVTIQQLLDTQRRVQSIPRISLKENLRDFFLSYSDIENVPLLTDILVYVPMDAPAVRDGSDLFIEICDMEVILRNNTYNFNLAKIALTEIRFSYSRSADSLHIAAGMRCAIWTYNEGFDDWEMFIEPFGVTSIAATDASSSFIGEPSFVVPETIQEGGEGQEDLDMDSEKGGEKEVVEERALTPTIQKIRFEIYSGPIEINAAQLTVTGIIRKLALADVVTSASVDLPPYKVINELGIPVTCSINSTGTVVTLDEIPIGAHLPIEVHHLAEADHNSRRIHRSRTKPGDVNQYGARVHSREHLLSIAFTVNRGVFSNTFDAIDAVPVDREGFYPFKMRLIRSDKQVYTAVSRSLIIENMTRKQDSNVNFNDIIKTPSVEGGSVSSERSQTSKHSSRYAPDHESGLVIVGPRSGAKPEPVSSGPVTNDTEVPLALVSMRVKSNGGRELVLRSILSLKNNTSRVFQLSIRRGVDSTETSLGPGCEWNVPVTLAHPKAALYIRLDERAEWFEALPSFESLILQGLWGSPTRLCADMCGCPPETPIAGGVETSWVLLLKPEVRSAKHGSAGSGSQAYMNVKYPTKDAINRGQGGEEGSGSVKFNEMYNLGFNGVDVPGHKPFGQNMNTDVTRPMCIQLLAPLQLCNVLSQPLLYRIADKEGLISSEGVLLPGDVLDVHSLYQLFSGKVYMSVRLLNYCWSTWVKIFTRNNPYPTSERLTEVTLTSMELVYSNIDPHILPPLGITFAMREHVLRISCPVLISNRTGLQIDFCESSVQVRCIHMLK
jgi:hypothetical protein